MSYPIAIYPAKVFASGQISFPAKIRDYLGVTKDDELRFQIESDGTVTVSKDRPIEEDIEAIWANMDPKVRKRAQQNAKKFLNSGKDWPDTPEGQEYLKEQYGV